LEVDVDNFDDRMKAINPRVAFHVPDTLSDSGKNLPIDISFESMDDFSPAAVVSQVDSLNKLLEARTQLKNLLTFMDGKAGAEDWIADILNDPALLKSMVAAPKTEAVTNSDSEDQDDSSSHSEEG
jgi:type VI secretion system protein ImpB